VKLYDTKTGQLEEFRELHPGQVSIYVCGPTVQDAPHIGHLRAAIAFDVLRRYLLYLGKEVTYVRNVTDIDDKVLAKAEQFGEKWWERAYRYEREFSHAYDGLNVLAPSYEPRATGQMTEIVQFISRLLDRNHAYLTSTGVYFSVPSWPEYGELTKQFDKQSLMSQTGESDKRDPRDFALWKFTKTEEPGSAVWPAPFGPGRPGWHIECSAMALRYLGESFDLHGGGIDLRFPHHENEIAQSRAAGYSFARHWAHSAWVTLAGEKMSKSIGNVLGLETVAQQLTPFELRFALASVHYRKNIEWGDDFIHQSAQAAHRFHQAVTGLGARASGDLTAVKLPDAVAAAFDDDLNLAAVLKWLFETAGELATADPYRGLQFRKTLALLGCDPLDDHWQVSAAQAGDLLNLSAEQVLTLARPWLASRERARRARNFTEADQIRRELESLGVKIEDTPDGPKLIV
jgi:cysteinyl-tRNA synthetase